MFMKPENPGDWEKRHLSLKQVSFSTIGLVGLLPALETAKRKR